jgi:hypothetical protein
MFIFVCSFFVNWVCWVRGNFSGEPGHVYFVCVCLRCVECRAGTILIGHFGGVGGGTVRIFLFLWLCSGRYGTVRLVRGRWSVFSLLSSVCCPFFWRLGVFGRKFFCVIHFLLVVCSIFPRFLSLQVADCK